ncbi:hypothetical protein [Tenacibaculum maritimum]|uniref:hypothetical protein n=1 Tax=Tenacibaculum maritimum TaxID=107401 RepID=UPI0012E63E80|nr:hypothetical protein [Tenacibaculum maritimum]MCD9586021.1 hypothetical protein [Tenacibaculum maritimum]MCD9621962.1 hypothetical protein [Tenacibaculum maritimum]MCD9628343.1 hypothetical protein [Tenacibaculum maritimum]MCD9631391.1 hypothetical protein [Tenacibaculum maritimum]MCD9634068.1 hypothetical protein [Tenacibaculum maritimum]
MAAAKIKFGTYAATPPAFKPIEAKAIVQFRPHKYWKGEFGFDWMRMGDTKIDGDIDYKKNVGNYGKIYAVKEGARFTPSKYIFLENEYTPKIIVEKKDTSNKPKKYYTPLLSLYKDPDLTNNPAAKLQLLIEIIEEPDELYIEFPKAFFEITNSIISKDNRNLKHFNIHKKSITKRRLHKLNLEIKCIDTFENDKTLRVFAIKNKEDGSKGNPKLAGQLKVKANSKPHRRISKIVFINVITNIKETRGSKKEGISKADSAAQKAYLEPFLKQALIKPKIENKDLYLFDTSNPNTRVLNKNYTITKNGVKMYSKTHTSTNHELADFLVAQFNATPANNKYKNHYKVFFLGEQGGIKLKESGKIINIGGASNGIGSKECVMYSNPLKFFLAHELMHCMGLYHSFDNKSKHTFKLGQTENVMDYSHIQKYAKPNSTLTQISTWAWQWSILKDKNEKEV